MEFYAHTAIASDGTPRSKEHWEPLFTPWHDQPARHSLARKPGPAHDLPTNPQIACSGRNAQPCPHCENLEPTHGHLNKVAHLTAEFAAEMFPESEDRESARQWGHLTGLWHDLGKFAPAWQDYLASKADPHRADISGTVPHSTSGAHNAHTTITEFSFGTLLASLIAGHHSGIANSPLNY